MNNFLKPGGNDGCILGCVCLAGMLMLVLAGWKALELVGIL